VLHNLPMWCGGRFYSTSGLGEKGVTTNWHFESYIYRNVRVYRWFWDGILGIDEDSFFLSSSLVARSHN